MGAGDTIGGTIRVIKEDTEGNRNVVFGPVATDAVDAKNGNLSPDEKIYVNTMLSDLVAAPLQAKEYRADGAQFFPGEKLIVQHQSSTLEEAADADAANAYAIDILKRDRNTDRVYPSTLTEANQEISANPTTSTTSFVDVYQETTSDRQEIRLAGSFEAGAYENA